MKRIFMPVLALAIVLAFAGCVTKSSALDYTPGTYSARAVGYDGYVTVEVTVDENGGVSVTADAPYETDFIGGMAVTILTENFMETKSEELDIISGATVTSEAFIRALKEALEQARNN